MTVTKESPGVERLDITTIPQHQTKSRLPIPRIGTHRQTGHIQVTSRSIEARGVYRVEAPARSLP